MAPKKRIRVTTTAPNDPIEILSHGPGIPAIVTDKKPSHPVRTDQTLEVGQEYIIKFGKGSGIDVNPIVPPDINDIVTPLVWYVPSRQAEFTPGNPVETLTDYGGLGADATQAVTASRATAQADGSLLFDGVDDTYNFNPTTSTVWNIFIVLQTTAWVRFRKFIASGNLVLCLGNANNGEEYQCRFETIFGGGTVTLSGNVLDKNIYHLELVNLSTSRLYINNIQSGATFTPSDFSAQNSFWLATRNGTNDALTGKFWEFVMINSTLTADQRTAITDILNTRWSVY